MIDAIQSGLGGTDTWSPLGRPLERYRIKVAPLSYGFTLGTLPAGPSTKGARAASATETPEVFRGGEAPLAYALCQMVRDMI